MATSSDVMYDEGSASFCLGAAAVGLVERLKGLRCALKSCAYDAAAAPSGGGGGGESKSALQRLRDHLLEVHGSLLCEVCVGAGRSFVCELRRYSPAALRRHAGRREKVRTPKK